MYWFSNNGKEKLYLSSADLMTRNLDRRIEVAFPIFDPNLIKEVKKILELELLDNTKARIIDKENSNTYQKTDITKNYRSQIDIYSYLKHSSI
jgi:polyphosphate kinase